jgi:uncharacterized Zn finger protein
MATMTVQTPTITGKGTMKDGRRVFTVQSQSEANRWYLVIVNPGHLQCDCPAGAHGKVCKHRKIVHARLVEERDMAAAAKRDAAPMYRDNRAFSIWKA